MTFISVNTDLANEVRREAVRAKRSRAYKDEADPIAIKMLREEATKEEWLAKIEEIKLRYPYDN